MVGVRVVVVGGGGGSGGANHWGVEVVIMAPEN